MLIPGSKKQIKDNTIQKIVPKGDGKNFYVYKRNGKIYDGKATIGGLYDPLKLAQNIAKGFFVRVRGKRRWHSGATRGFWIY